MTSSKGPSARPGQFTHKWQHPTCVPSCATTLQKFSRSCSRHCSSSRLWSITLQAGGGQQQGGRVGEGSEGWTAGRAWARAANTDLQSAFPHSLPHMPPPCLKQGPTCVQVAPDGGQHRSQLGQQLRRRKIREVCTAADKESTGQAGVEGRRTGQDAAPATQVAMVHVLPRCYSFPNCQSIPPHPHHCLPLPTRWQQLLGGAPQEGRALLGRQGRLHLAAWRREWAGGEGRAVTASRGSRMHVTVTSQGMHS